MQVVLEILIVCNCFRFMPEHILVTVLFSALSLHVIRDLVQIMHLKLISAPIQEKNHTFAQKRLVAKVLKHRVIYKNILGLTQVRFIKAL